MSDEVSVNEIGNGYYVVIAVWPKNIEVEFTLTLTDPDGDIDETTWSYKPTVNTPMKVALDEVAAGIDALPHWRAVRPSDNELSIGAADSDYGYSVDARVV